MGNKGRQYGIILSIAAASLLVCFAYTECLNFKIAFLLNIIWHFYMSWNVIELFYRKKEFFEF